MKSKRRSRYVFRISQKANSTAYGGQLIVDAMCRRFGIWTKLTKANVFNSCDDKTSGFTSEVLAAQIIFTITSGGTGLTHLDRLRNDPVMIEAVGLNRMADSDTVVRWLEALTPASVAELRAINAVLVEAVLRQADPARVWKNGVMRVIYEDRPLKMGPYAGMRPDAERIPALSQYVLWAGPFMLELGADTAETICGGILGLIPRYRHIWEGTICHFIADTEEGGAHIRNVRKEGFTLWSVHNPKWNEYLSNKVAELPEHMWTAKKPLTPGATEDYTAFYHSLEGAPLSQSFVVSRKKRSGTDGPPWQYTFLTCEPGGLRTPEAIFDYHRMRGGELEETTPYLAELGFRRPPCQALAAGQAFYTLVSIAWNIVMAIKVLEMPDEAQTWQMGDIIHNLLHVPATHVRHANRSFLNLNMASHPYQKWWVALLEKFASKRSQNTGFLTPPPSLNIS
jgi:hypothetical protein